MTDMTNLLQIHGFLKEYFNFVGGAIAERKKSQFLQRCLKKDRSGCLKKSLTCGGDRMASSACCAAALAYEHKVFIDGSHYGTQLMKEPE